VPHLSADCPNSRRWVTDSRHSERRSRRKCRNSRRILAETPPRRTLEAARTAAAWQWRVGEIHKVARTACAMNFFFQLC